MAEIPKLKKKISAFLTSEEGKISKESLLKTGVMLGAVALGSLLGASDAAAEHHSIVNHNNVLGVSYNDAAATATGTHNHHASHDSY